MDNVPPLGSGRLWKSKADFFRPFRTAAAAEGGKNITPLYDPVLHRQTDGDVDLRGLNVALAALIGVFPEVELEVLREMLANVSERSRVEIVTEQLLKRNANQVSGLRKKFRKQQPPGNVAKARPASRQDEDYLPAEETFRSDSYKQAVKQVLYQEFRSLSHSSIKAVMAEQNNSYTFSRRTLQQLASKSWRFTISNIWSRRSPMQNADQHPNILTQGSAESGLMLHVKRTGNAELDHELYELLVEPVLRQQRHTQLAADLVYATHINDAEAEAAEALFDCECCYSSVSFEQLAVCSNGCHQLCFDCIKRSVNEALYGQGWARTIDLEKGSVRCFAPAPQECLGSINAAVVRRAVTSLSLDEEVWHELQARMASEALVKSRLPLQRCPSCGYAEVDEVPSLKLRHAMAVWHHIATRASVTLQIMLLSLTAALLLFTVPLLLLASIAYMAISLVPPAGAIIDSSWTRVYKRRRGLKFGCRSPACRKTSCMRCTSIWRDPHVCFEDEKTTLRTAIESSATAAVKRTCPRCLLSFVKSSGCNKLVCNCGYTMCYICRQEITSKEGYGHFCQHFRPSGGRCSECDRCDLYGDEDEEAAIRKAVATAKKAWREKEGNIGENIASKLMVEVVVGQARRGIWYECSLDVVMDAIAA